MVALLFVKKLHLFVGVRSWDGSPSLPRSRKQQKLRRCFAARYSQLDFYQALRLLAADTAGAVPSATATVTRAEAAARSSGNGPWSSGIGAEQSTAAWRSKG